MYGQCYLSPILVQRCVHLQQCWSVFLSSQDTEQAAGAIGSCYCQSNLVKTEQGGATLCDSTVTHSLARERARMCAPIARGFVMGAHKE